MADADATELQGKGESLWGKHPEENERKEEEEKQDAERVFLPSFSSLQEKRNGMDTSEARARARVEEGRRQPGLREARQPDAN